MFYHCGQNCHQNTWEKTNQSSGGWCKRASVMSQHSYYWRVVAIHSGIMTLCFEQPKTQSMPITSVRRSWPMQIKSDLWKVPFMGWWNYWKWPKCHKNNWYALNTALKLDYLLKTKLWEKNNQSLHYRRDKGIPSECPWFATSTTQQAKLWIANHGHSDGIPFSLREHSHRFY